MPMVKSVLQDYVDALHSNLDAHELEQVFNGDKVLTSIDLGNQPEPWTEDNLIWPLLDAVGLTKDPQPYGGGDRPDFELLNVDVDVLGENKSPNKIDDAEEDLKSYLRDKALGADHGIATDGFEWVVYKIELGGDFVQFPEIARVSLRQAIAQIAADRGYVSGLRTIDVDEEIESFTDVFERDEFNTLLTEKAPQKLRDERKRDVEEFYDLYIELLFGAGDKYEYDTSLLDDVKAPYDASEKDQRVFAITLVNRLLFIKFLEEKGVLHDGFLLDRVEAYEDSRGEFAGSLYDSQLRPLFYGLLNTHEDNRDAKYHDDDSWFSDVPYLNGGLFRANVDREAEYSVRDRILPTVINDLIEGTALDTTGSNGGGGLDPAIIGSVFEKTINHLEQERDQRDIGAYYTPNDVTRLITRQTVDEKVREEILDAYAGHVSLDDEEFKDANDDKPLDELLRDIEDSAGWFGFPDATRDALDRLNELTVFDSACGSGHFLTTALDEIHRVQLALMRGLHGSEPDAADAYDAKKELALQSIYGVDIEPVGVEIAKLRVWLKIVEDGWHDGFGKLPNIDVNIAAGNSLIGLPTTGTRTGTLDMLEYRDRIKDVVELRREYKYEDETDADASAAEKREIRRILDEELRPELDEVYLEQQNYSVDTEITDVEAFNELVEAIDDQHLYPTIESIKAKPADGSGITDSQEDTLDEYGFSVYSKSARLDVDDREQALRKGNGANGDGPTAREQIVDELRDLLTSGFEFTEVIRQPVQSDLETAQGPPFHWIAEFPEVADIEDMTVDFDIILGNPPYGDILDDADSVLVDGYETGGVPDISAQFVERQLQLLDDGGYFGNITTLRLVYQTSLEEFHEHLRDRLDTTRVACFGTRPSRVFENADIKVAIFTGRKHGDPDDEDGEIRTSDAIIFSDEDRQQKFRNVEYEAVDGYVLRDKIGGTEGNKTALPKIGSETKCEILDTLRDQSDRLMSDAYEREETGTHEHAVWRREGVRYWINPMLGEALYDAREVKPMYFETKLEQQAAFLSLSSSLFYVYWLTYGNFHHLNWLQIEGFPFHDHSELEPYADRVEELAEELWTGMQDQFDPDAGVTGEFDMKPLKPVMNDVDELVGETYGLSEEQVSYIQEYLTDEDGEYGRSGPSARVTDFT